MNTPLRRSFSLTLLFFLLFQFVPATLASSTASSSDLLFDSKDQVHGRNYQAEDYFLEHNSMGAFTYQLPIQIPPGRSGFQPDLKLTYNSQNTAQDSLYGYGWSLDIPSIQRFNKTGVDKLYDDNYFSSSLDGELVEVSLTSDPYGTYAARVDKGSFLSYEYESDYWVVTDKSGNTYTFGESTDAQQSDANDDTVIYRWMLEEVEDKNGNTIRYEYTKDQGQIYPDAIYYTGFGSDDGRFSIDFETESRQGSQLSYSTGFEVITASVVSDITVYDDADWVRTYELDYSRGDNTDRILLASVTETVKSDAGEELTLEPTEFDYQSSTKTWSAATTTGYDLNLVLADYPTSGTNTSSGNQLIDVNGDALPDAIYSSEGTIGEISSSAHLNRGDGYGWQADSVEDFDIPAGFISYHYLDRAVRVGDVNGDGHLDLVKAKQGEDSQQTGTSYIENGTFLSNADGTGWTKDESFNKPGYFLTEFNGVIQNGSSRLFDANGDGLSDWVVATEYNGAVNYSRVHLNDADGTGWTEDTGYSVPIGFADTGLPGDNGVRTADINGDGLLDLVRGIGSIYGTNGIYLNTGDGTGWDYNSVYNLPLKFVQDHNGWVEDEGVRLVDINGDGLSDLVYSIEYNGAVTSSRVHLNTAYGHFEEDSEYEFPAGILYYTRSGDQAFRFTDINGDGLVDIIKGDQGGANNDLEGIYFHDGEVPDLLSGITGPRGATTEITYKGSAEYNDSNGQLNPDLPFIIQTVESITTNDGLGNESTVTYEYAGGEYYYEDERNRQFAGFESVSATQGDREAIQYFHQGDEDGSLIGQPYRREIYDDSGNLYQVTLDSWENTDLGYNNDFVYRSQTITMDYDGQSSHRDTATQYSYDSSNGNLTQEIYWGEVMGSDDKTFTDVTGDSFTTDYDYAEDSNGVLQDFVSEITRSNEDGDTVHQERFEYDEENLGVVSTGNLTAHAVWQDDSGDWLETNYEVDSYGLRTSETNARGYSTQVSYDTDALYPATVTNALGQSVSYEYDYRSGQVTQSTDPNGHVSETAYDGLGRPTSLSVPDPDTGTTTELTTITYDDENFPNYSMTTTTVDGISMVSLQYVDGFGRVIREGYGDEDGNPVITDTFYDELGRVEQVTLPYRGTATTTWSGLDSTQASMTYTYDTLGRPLTETSPTGTTTFDYDHWEQTITDPNGIDKGYEYDAYQRLIQVQEHNDGDTYTTTYDYDDLGYLAQITDNDGNERAFDYDSLGWLLSQENLHDAAASSVSTWTYTYDDNGNRLTQTDPNGDVISWTYDELDRLESEDWDNDSSDDITYSYDSATNGVGLLASVSLTDYSVSYSYDAQGGVSTETKTIDGTSYSMGFTNDLMGRPTQLDYDNGAMTVEYIYNGEGRIDHVKRDGTHPIVTDVDYSPMGQISYLAYGNLTATTNNYSASNGYRLDSRVTTGVYEDDMDGDGVAASSDICPATESVDSNDTVDSDGCALSQLDGDEDDLSDYEEIYVHGTDETDHDSDDDGKNDGQEIQEGTDPNDALSYAPGLWERSMAWLLPVAHATQQSGNIQDLSYTYDANGNITDITDASITWTAKDVTYTYDDLNRLMSASTSNFLISDYTQDYEYDALGNITNKSDFGQLNYGEGGAHPHAVTSTDRGMTATYDANGNLVTLDADTYTWTIRNELESGAGLEYDYDHQGQRYKKTDLSDGSETLYISQYHEMRPDETYYYIYLGNKRVAQVEVGTNETNYYHEDHLGGTAMMTDTNGVIVELYEYYPYGDQVLTESSGTDSANYSFTGKEYEDRLNLYYFEARWYSAMGARFTSVDPLQLYPPGMNLGDPQQLNAYSYARNNPLIYIDPTGLEATVIIRSDNDGLLGIDDFGHTAIEVDGVVYHYYGVDPGDENWNEYITGVDGVVEVDYGIQGFVSGYNGYESADEYFTTYTIETTDEQNALIVEYFRNLMENTPDYELFSNNCTTVVQDALESAGVADFSGGIKWKSLTPASFGQRLQSMFFQGEVRINNINGFYESELAGYN